MLSLVHPFEFGSNRLDLLLDIVEEEFRSEIVYSVTLKFLQSVTTKRNEKKLDIFINVLGVN